MHDEEVAIAVVAIVFGIPMVIVLAKSLINGVVRVVCHWREVSLKIRLAERGMSAYEIEQVVRAGRDEKGAVQPMASVAETVPSKPPKTPHYAARF